MTQNDLLERIVNQIKHEDHYSLILYSKSGLTTCRIVGAQGQLFVNDCIHANIIHNNPIEETVRLMECLQTIYISTHIYKHTYIIYAYIYYIHTYIYQCLRLNYN